MTERLFPDEWLVPTISAMITPEAVAALRAAAEPTSTLWDLVTAKGYASDEQMLAALSKRCRVPVADAPKPEPRVKEVIPEAVARRYHVVPLKATDSVLEIGTSNPFDIDAEKGLAFASGREVRMQLMSPAKIAALTDEIYRPENVIDKLLEGMEGGTEVEQLKEEVEDEIQVSAEEASQRPVKKSKRQAILGKLGLQDDMTWEDPNPYPFDRKVFEIYAPHRDPSTKEMDEVYRISDAYLIHKVSGLRLAYSESESYYGDASTFSLHGIFIITLRNQRLDVVDVDFANQLFVTPKGKIPFSAVKKDSRGD